MKLSQVIINSVTIKDTDGSPDPNKLISWEYEKSDEEISGAEMILPNSVNDLLSILPGQVVEIHGGWTTSTDKRYFYGFVDKVVPEGATIKVLCKNEMIQLVRKNINKVYDSTVDASAGEISEIVEDMVETYGGMTATVQSSGTEDGKRVDQFKCINTDIWERVQALKKALDWDLFYDDNARIVYFQPNGYTDSGITLTVGTTIINMPDWDHDTSNMINDLRVDGASVPTDITESGKIETTADYLNESILLTKTPENVELLMDASATPTTQKIGGSKDGSSGHFYYVDKENKKIMPATSTTFTTDHYAIVNYTWSAEMPIHMKNQDSIDDYGLYQKTLEYNDISSIADAESRATNILSKRSVPFISTILQVRSEAANIPDRGDVVEIVDEKSPKYNGVYLSGDYVVNKIKYKFPSAFEELEIGDKKWRLADWQQTTEERLKRLEEQFVRNQDILVELVGINNSEDQNLLKPYPRWFKALEQNVSGESMIWGNVSFGIWGTSKWGSTAQSSFILGNAQSGLLGISRLGSQVSAEALKFMIQYDNTYTEEFIDADFEDTDGTASWSTTGSVTFTSGQIALSSSIDYANGTITVATLTSTEVSGAFDYEITADGTNWESATSGVAHTFSNTGTDLRWRATENNTSTGEISKIIVSNYH